MTSQSGQDSSVTINSKRVVSKRPGHSVTPFVCPTNVYTKGKGSRYAVFHFFRYQRKVIHELEIAMRTRQLVKSLYSREACELIVIPAEQFDDFTSLEKFDRF